MNFEDIMKVAGVTHRDVPGRKKALLDDVLKELEYMKENIYKIDKINRANNIDDDIFSSGDILKIFDGLIDKCSSDIATKTNYTHIEFILLMVATGLGKYCGECVSLDFDRYMKIKTHGLYESVKKYYEYKEKYIQTEE